MDAAEDQVFGAFCREIGVANIRDYEARQLKLAQEESEARLRFETQIARLSHLYDMHVLSPVDHWSDHPRRCQFEEEQLKKLQERLNVLVETAAREEKNTKSFEDKKAEAQEELERMQEGLKELEAEMSRIKATLDEKAKEVEEAKRAASKAAKALEQAEKEISSRVRALSKHIRFAIVCWSDDKLRDQNDEIERLGLERSGLYRKSRLEEIKLPLVAGNLKNVPMEEVRRPNFSL